MFVCIRLGGSSASTSLHVNFHLILQCMWKCVCHCYLSVSASRFENGLVSTYCFIPVELQARYISCGWEFILIIPLYFSYCSLRVIQMTLNSYQMSWRTRSPCYLSYSKSPERRRHVYRKVFQTMETLGNE